MALSPSFWVSFTSFPVAEHTEIDALLEREVFMRLRLRSSTQAHRADRFECKSILSNARSSCSCSSWFENERTYRADRSLH
jgi:hypothetical protein